MRLSGNVAFSACSLRFSIADSLRNGEKMQDGLNPAVRCMIQRYLLCGPRLSFPSPPLSGDGTCTKESIELPRWVETVPALQIWPISALRVSGQRGSTMTPKNDRICRSLGDFPRRLATSLPSLSVIPLAVTSELFYEFVGNDASPPPK